MGYGEQSQCGGRHTSHRGAEPRLAAVLSFLLLAFHCFGLFLFPELKDSLKPF